MLTLLWRLDVNINAFLNHSPYLYVYECAHMCIHAMVYVRRILLGVGSFLLPVSLRNLNSATELGSKFI